MKREDFLGPFLGFVIQRVPDWLPEEATEELFLEIMQQRLKEHSDVIMKVIKRVSSNTKED